MIYECPKCGVQYEIDQPGEYQCSQCNQVFIVEPEPQPQPQPMKIAQPVQPVQPAKTTEQKQHTIICPFCQSELPENVKKCVFCNTWLPGKKPLSMLIYCLLGIVFTPTIILGVHLFYIKKKWLGTILLLLTLSFPILLALSNQTYEEKLPFRGNSQINSTQASASPSLIRRKPTETAKIATAFLAVFPLVYLLYFLITFLYGCKVIRNQYKQLPHA